MIGIETRRDDRGPQVIAVNPGEQIAVDDVRSGIFGDRLLVAGHGIGLRGGDPGAAHIGEIGAQRLGRQDRTAAGDRPGQRHRPGKPGADFLHQCERRLHPGMAASPRSHRNQAIGALVDRLARIAIVDDVMQHQPAPAVYRCIDLGLRAQRGDDHGHLVLFAQRKILLQPVVGAMDNQIDCERRGRRLGMQAIMRGQFLGDAVQPFVELGRGPRVQGRETADNARLALGNDQFRSRDDKHRRADHRQAKRVEQGRQDGEGHAMIPARRV